LSQQLKVSLFHLFFGSKIRARRNWTMYA